MIRNAVLAALVLTVAACSGGDNSELERSVVLDGAAGRPFSVRLSPDGARIAWAMPVNGRSAIFVARADGSDPVQLTSGVWDAGPVWSPDGQWIAYHAESPDFDVFVVPAGGGEARQLTSGPEGDSPMAWTPDGSGIVVLRGGAGPLQTLVFPVAGGDPSPLVRGATGPVEAFLSPDGRRVAWETAGSAGATIWVRDLPDGAPRQLGAEGTEFLRDAPWSPDGRRLLYGSTRTGTEDLWIADVETGETRQLTTDVRDDNSGVWSPDGQWVAFLSQRGGQQDVWIVPAAGGDASRVTNDLAADELVAWSRDGLSLLYVSRVSTAGLQSMPLGGGAATDLLRWDGYDMSDPEISPDGERVAFVSDRAGNPDVWVVPLRGGEPRPLAASAGGDFQPRWSPDGAHIAFASTRTGRTNIYVTALADSGRSARTLTDFPEHADVHAWSPDGSTIAFHSPRGSSQPEVWTIPAGGGAARQVTRGGTAAEDVRWSRDGRTLYFTGNNGSGGRQVFSVPASGGRPRSLGAVESSLANLRVSPDGAWLSYSAFPAGWGYLKVLPASGGTPRALTTETEDVYHPAALWLPDGSGLVTVSYHYPSDTYDLYRVSFPGGEWEPLTLTPDVSEFWMAFSPDGSQIVFVATTVKVQVYRVSVAALLAGR